MIEAGLVEEYKDRTYRKAREKYFLSKEERLEIKEKPKVAPLSLDDLQGLFYLTAVLMVFSLISFIIEISYGKLLVRRENISQK